MKRRDFIKTALAAGTAYATSAIPGLAGTARAAGVPALGNRVLVNIMLAGAPDFRHLFTPPYDPNPASYGYRFWEAKAAAHSIEKNPSAYEQRWLNDYLQASDGATDFGILGRCGWLKSMWDAGHVAIIANAGGASSRDHDYAQLVMNQGNLSSGPNDRNRSGWGGRLAYYSSGAALSVARMPGPFVFGPHPTDPDNHDNSNLISASNMREFTLFSANGYEPLDLETRMSRSLRGYYAALRQDGKPASVYDRFVNQEQALRVFGEPVEARLASTPVPDSITALMQSDLSLRTLALQIRSVYDGFVCSDILNQRVVSLHLDGWDTHRTQKDIIEPQLEDLFGDGKALDVLYQELPNSVLDNTVMVIGGEFGRQLRANGDGGTDHGQGTCLLLVGNSVRGGIYGDMFPLEELNRLEDESPDVTTRTTFDSIYAQVCDWIQPGTGSLVFPDTSRSMVESGVDLGTLFL